MIFHLSTPKPRRIGISKAWGQKGRHNKILIICLLEWHRLLVFLWLKLMEKVSLACYKDYRGVNLTILQGLLETIQGQKEFRLLVSWWSSEARKRNYHSNGKTGEQSPLHCLISERCFTIHFLIHPFDTSYRVVRGDKSLREHLGAKSGTHSFCN